MLLTRDNVRNGDQTKLRSGVCSPSEDTKVPWAAEVVGGKRLCQGQERVFQFLFRPFVNFSFKFPKSSLAEILPLKYSCLALLY